MMSAELTCCFVQPFNATASSQVFWLPFPKKFDGAVQYAQLPEDFQEADPTLRRNQPALSVSLARQCRLGCIQRFLGFSHRRQSSGHPLIELRTKRRPTANLIIGNRSDRMKSCQAKKRPQSRRRIPQRRARIRIVQNLRALPFAYVGRKASLPWRASARWGRPKPAVTCSGFTMPPCSP